MHVLITSAGRRVSLLENFRRAACALVPDASAKVYAADLAPQLSAACRVADASAAVPRVDDPGYVGRLLELCKQWNISVVVPTIDTELVPLAEAKRDFAELGTTVAVSDPQLCRAMNSKRDTAALFERLGFPTPAIIDELEHAAFPLFAKLDNSSRSIGAGVVHNLAEAQRLRDLDPNYVFQELIDGVEFTVDAFVDSKRNALGIVPRQRQEVRAGEVSKGCAIKDPVIMGSVRELCGCLEGAYGTLTVQLFQQDDGALSFIEVNPRFGGGYPLTMHAGADFAEYLLRDVRGDDQSYRDDWHDGTLMLRYDAEVIVRDRSF